MQARQKLRHRLPEEMIEEAEDGKAQPADDHDVGMRWKLGVILPDGHVDAEQEAQEAVDESGCEERSGNAAHVSLLSLLPAP